VVPQGMRPKLLMVSRTRYAAPLSRSLRRKFDALEAEFELRVLAASAGEGVHDPHFRLFRPVRPRVLDGPLFYALLPFRVMRELRRFRPDAVVAQGSQETSLVLLARVLARAPACVIADIHADPATPTRLYGSPFRKSIAPLADLLARWGIRGADGVRTVSDFTSRAVRAAGVEPTATFPAFIDLDAFLEPPVAPLPECPSVVSVGVLERYKATDVLADAWRIAAPQVPHATLHLIGRGTLTGVAEGLVTDLPHQTRWTEALPTEGVAQALDDATVVVLPSRSEGLPRIIIEAACRGRAAVATAAGGIPDLVTHGENGLLVPSEDAAALADALVGVLSDGELAERLGDASRTAVEQWVATPEEYARRVRDLVEQVSSANLRTRRMRFGDVRRTLAFQWRRSRSRAPSELPGGLEPAISPYDGSALSD
jgi:glycosyltransferase involved in cell wall biosynthesis